MSSRTQRIETVGWISPPPSLMRAASPGLLVSLGALATKWLTCTMGARRLKPSKLWSLLGESYNSSKRGHLPTGATEFRATGEPKFPNRNPSKSGTTAALAMPECWWWGDQQAPACPDPGPGPASGPPPGPGPSLASRFPASAWAGGEPLAVAASCCDRMLQIPLQESSSQHSPNIKGLETTWASNSIKRAIFIDMKSNVP